jgi:hypothetical protein
MVLRNCVAGSAEAALEPAGAAAVSFGAPVGTASGAQPLTLSPLAAPMP